ncbi:probable glycosyltransferase At5g03795 [Cornus florida]|uniref:probable glycosyltransferase At5g03795 n=1 Tax=Cornus florida TaxID=4283 RepID=UPI00289B6242|nr:probable glycosyltransferase At5g03795 [Cornus florida]
MAIITSLSILLILFFSLSTPSLSLTSPYLSPTTLFPDYQKMLNSFRIYIYTPPKPFTFTTPSESLFHSSLLNSSFLTQNPNQAHLFFVPFPSDQSKRSLSRHLRDLRINLPYWNRTLGADHFFVSRAGVAFESDRNLVELKKNSVQISCFPTTSGNFIPHKDITLPPMSPSLLSLPHAPVNETARFVGFYYKRSGENESILVNELNGDPEFLVGSEPSDYVEGLRRSKFCLFVYGDDVVLIGEALTFGCVPVVITDRPIQDLPLMDVVRWSDIAVFVGTGGGVERVKEVLSRIGGDQYERMRESGVTASQHFIWNASPLPYDAFHMVMYQLWLRRHTIRYARSEVV